MSESVKCPRCGFEAPSTASFCSSCGARLPSLIKTAESIPCHKCGYSNPATASFCSSCGAKLWPKLTPAEVKGRLEGLSLLLAASSAYLMISSVNAILQANFSLFAVLYVASALCGLYAAYKLYKGDIRRRALIAAVATVFIGFGSTFTFFFLLVTLAGVVLSPAWVLFLTAGWKLWKDRLFLVKMTS